nr:unnamed protein product [Callosobruchus chinensis]
MYAQGYADDIVILIRGKHMGTCLEMMQRAISIVERWCVTEGLSVNPSKTIMVPFTKQRNAKITRAPILFGNQIEVAREVKYLGIKKCGEAVETAKHVMFDCPALCRRRSSYLEVVQEEGRQVSIVQCITQFAKNLGWDYA